MSLNVNLKIISFVADMLKCMLKKIIVPINANKFLFFLAPIMVFSLYLTLFTIIPFSPDFLIADISFGILFIFAILLIVIFCITLAGFAANSRYSIIGAIRAASQLISYNAVLFFIVLIISMSANSFSFSKIIETQEDLWYIFPHFPLFVMFLVCMLSQSMRAPFDLPNADNEISSGYLAEYSGFPLALFLIAEYLSMLFMSIFGVILFLGGYNPPFGIVFIPPLIWLLGKAFIFLLIYIFVKAAMLRFRQDQLMKLCWKFMMPFVLFWFIVSAGVVYGV